jgi:uncharacterized protein YdhG (YjbR/CyaY superfamily)
MQLQANSPEDYINQLPEARREGMSILRNTILQNLPNGFEETISYGMIGYVVPKSIYPEGYHCDPDLPVPFASIASQKGYISFYHYGLYADKELLHWFVSEFPNHSTSKLDMGKSCVRFKRPDQIPYTLIGQLMQKITVADWIQLYSKQLKK